MVYEQGSAGGEIASAGDVCNEKAEDVAAAEGESGAAWGAPEAGE